MALCVLKAVDGERMPVGDEREFCLVLVFGSVQFTDASESAAHWTEGSYAT